MNEKRIQTRYAYPATIEYLLDSSVGAEVVHKAVTVNISASGMAAYVFDRLPEGQKVIIKSSLPVDCQAAAVCWTKKEDHRFYLSGFKFV